MRIGHLVPIGFLVGSIACAVLLAHPPRAIATDLAQPLPVVTYWKTFGALMFAALFFATAIACVGYVGVLRSLSALPLDELGVLRYLRMTAGISAIACAAALTFPVIFSSDVYAYAGYGYLALHGINPYAHARIASHEPLLDAMVWQWGNPPPMCVYGPLFVWIAQAIVAVTLPLGVAASLLAFRILACVALFSCAPLAYAAFQKFPERTRLAAAAGIALNPIAIWASGEGHNDAIVLAIVLAGFALAQRTRYLSGAIVVALAALVKAPAFAASLGMLAVAWHDRRRLKSVLVGSAIGVVITFAIAAPLEFGLRAHLAPAGKYLPQYSPQYVFASFLPMWLAIGAVVFPALALVAIGVRRLVALEFDGAIFIALGAWIAIPNPYPWYALWILPSAFLAWNTRAGWAVICASLLIVFRYFAEATSATVPLPVGIALVALEFLPALLLLSAYRPRHERLNRPAIRTPVPDFARLHSP